MAQPAYEVESIMLTTTCFSEPCPPTMTYGTKRVVVPMFGPAPYKRLPKIFEAARLSCFARLPTRYCTSQLKLGPTGYCLRVSNSPTEVFDLIVARSAEVGSGASVDQRV